MQYAGGGGNVVKSTSTLEVGSVRWNLLKDENIVGPVKVALVEVCPVKGLTDMDLVEGLVEVSLVEVGLVELGLVKVELVKA